MDGFEMDRNASMETGLANMSGFEVVGNATLTTKHLIAEAKQSGLMLISNIATFIAAFFALVNNSVVLFVCFRKRKKKMPLSRALISLTVSDLLLGIFFPFSVLSGFYDESTYKVCDTITYLVRIACFSMTGNGILVSVERYLAIKYSTRFKIVFSKTRATAAIASTWLFMLFPSVLMPNILWDGRFCNRRFTFQLKNIAFQLIVTIIPPIVAIIFYVLAYRLLRKETANFKTYRDIFITAIVVSGFNFIGMVILHSFILSEACGFGEYCGIPGRGFNMTLLLISPFSVTATSAANPIVSLIRCEELRQEMKLLFPRFFRRVEPLTNNPNVSRNPPSLPITSVIEVKPAPECSRVLNIESKARHAE